MRLFVDLAQVVDADLGVNLGRVEPGVSEQLLDAAQVRAVFHHVRGAAVPQQVAGALLLDPGGLERLAHPVAEIVRVEAFAVAAEKEGSFGQAHGQGRTALVQVGFQPAHHAAAQR